MTSAELRSGFLAFFERNGHRIVSSSSLVPLDDPTLLFTNAGMNQFKDLFLGRERRDYVRATSSQKCMRVSGKHNDLDNVGPSLRHHTFFEMLGNFSFGDYFKDEAIRLAWTLMTGDWAIPADRLFVTVFGGDPSVPRDDDAYRLWQRFVPADRIVELGIADNFWAMGETGPCGRCSEIHYFRGSHLPCPEPACQGVACSCDRFVEVWNNVFMEFDRQPDGTLNPLPAPSIDTGMGLERITAVMQHTLSNYDTDLFRPLLASIGDAAEAKYGASEAADVSMRVIADHMRAMTFLIADGVVPSNEWRGYVLRKIMRRAMRHGKRLGMTRPFLHSLVDTVVREMGTPYPELRTNRDVVVNVVRSEEERFDAVLTGGLARLEDVLERAATQGRVVPGEEVFRLYDSLGLPVDFIEDLAGERGLAVDREGYERAMAGQRERARAGSTFDARRGQEFELADDATREALRTAGDQFDGYDTTRVTGVAVLALFDEQRHQVTELTEGAVGFVAIERTPFYLEAGGQVSDLGQIRSEATGARAEVTGVARPNPGWPRLHQVKVAAGTFRPRDIVTVEVDRELRDATRRNHTATHLLHAALRQVLGPHVKQAGSLVAPDRLRFDFVHSSPVARQQLDEIERLVNEQIYRNTPVLTEVRSAQEAIAAGAMALFGEKYGERVRVVSIPGFSMELCGGTHCRATGDIGFFMITQETGIAAGVRRIEALTGAGAVRRYQGRRAVLDEMLGMLAVQEDRGPEAIQRLQADVKRLTKETSALRTKAAIGAGDQKEEIDTINGVKVLTRRVDDLDKTALRELADTLRNRLQSGIVVLAARQDGKVSIVVSVTKDLVGRAHAGQIVKAIAPIVGGGGGGRPDFAEAGGNTPEKIDELLRQSIAVVRTMIGG